MKMHKLEERSHFEELRQANDKSRSQYLRLAGESDTDLQLVYHQLVLTNYKHGCIAFILGGDDEQVKECFQKAAEYAVKLLQIPLGRIGLRSFEVDLEANHDGSLLGAEIRERKFHPEERKLSVDKFVAARMAITTFGDSSELIRVGNFPEEGYANPNVIPEPGMLEELRARKAWLRGDKVQAKREAESALSRSSNTRVRPSIEAFLSLANGEVQSFRTHLVDVVKQHAKFYKKYPHVAEGVICYPGMELCRLALDQGFPLDEQPYLPLRFLPNFSTL